MDKIFYCTPLIGFKYFDLDEIPYNMDELINSNNDYNYFFYDSKKLFLNQYQIRHLINFETFDNYDIYKNKETLKTYRIYYFKIHDKSRVLWNVPEDIDVRKLHMVTFNFPNPNLNLKKFVGRPYGNKVINPLVLNYDNKLLYGDIIKKGEFQNELIFVEKFDKEGNSIFFGQTEEIN